MTKVCTKCNQEKELDAFNVQNGRSYNRSSNCKGCKAEYRKKNRKALQKRKADYYKENKEFVNESCKKWYQANKEAVTKQRKKYRQANKDELTIKKRQYIRKRRNEDKSFKIKSNISRRIHHALKGQNKSDHTTTLLGCTPDCAKAHVESQFSKGMSWDNYGVHGWHIDHIIPCARFDLTDPEQQRKCFHYTNLQPLWAIENIKKGDKMPYELSTT